MSPVCPVERTASKPESKYHFSSSGETDKATRKSDRWMDNKKERRESDEAKAAVEQQVQPTVFSDGYNSCSLAGILRSSVIQL
ncbi:hypothetical protein NQZ68_027268 [Dissostichus eleginoides]|nr:hypothetical protein NQZ68_027268 [Dissostichus eleginoides]